MSREGLEPSRVVPTALSTPRVYRFRHLDVIPGQGLEPRLPRSERGVLPVRRSRIVVGAAAAAPTGLSVEERDVAHRLRALLGVHEHAVPARQGDRRVVGMAYRALGVQLGVADHAREVAAAALLVAESLVRGLSDACRVPAIHPHELAATAERELQDVGLAAAA